MTLVLSIATPEFVLQVSDRRLTRTYPTGVICVEEDDANKLTVFCNRMVFAYTGLAYVGAKKTDIWLSHILAELPSDSLSDAVNQIKKKATDAFSRLSYKSEVKRHAFIGVGWTRANVDAPILPIMCRISNFYDENGRALAVARNEFTSRYRIYEPPVYWGWLETGAYMSPKEISRLHRFMNRCARNTTGPGPVVRHFVSAIRTIAVRDKTVGENLLAVVMPRSVALAKDAKILSPGGWGVFAGDADPSSYDPNAKIDSVYIPKNNTRGVEYAPNFSCRGAAITNAVRVDI